MLELVETGTFARWLRRLPDRRAVDRIRFRVFATCREGRLVGDYKSVGGGVFEMRFDFGPGYRVYCAIEGNRLLLLLQGGSKARQQADIEKAKRLLRSWRCGRGED